jgi:hypothetical protein
MIKEAVTVPFDMEVASRRISSQQAAINLTLIFSPKRGDKGLPKNKLFQEKQEIGFLKNDNHFKGGEKGLPSATPFLPLIYA